MSSPKIPFRRAYYDTTPSLYSNMRRKRLTKSEMPPILNDSPYTQAVKANTAYSTMVQVPLLWVPPKFPLGGLTMILHLHCILIWEEKDWQNLKCRIFLMILHILRQHRPIQPIQQRYKCLHNEFPENSFYESLLRYCTFIVF